LAVIFQKPESKFIKSYEYFNALKYVIVDIV